MMRGFYCLAVFFGLLLVAGSAAAEKKSAAMVVADGALKSVVRVKLTMSGYQVLDAWREHDFFHGLSSLRTGNIDAPKPGFLPEALAPDWEKGMAACRARAGKPPYGMRNSVAFLCGQEMAEVMWQRWLDQSGVDLVLIVSTASAKVTEKDLKALRAGKFDPNKKKMIRTAVFAPQESSMRYLESEIPEQKDLPKKVSDQIKALLEGKGKTKDRQISRELPKSGFASANGGLSDELKQGKPLDLKPVALPKDCKALLPALKISPAKAPLAITIMRQWKKSMPGRHPAEKTLECTLALTLSQPIFGTTEVRSVGAILRCGDLQVSANRPGIKPSDSHRGLSKKLVSKLLKKLCK